MMFTISEPMKPETETDGNQLQGVCHQFEKMMPEPASRYSPALAHWRGVFTYHSERFSTRATHTMCCPGQPREHSGARRGLPRTSAGNCFRPPEVRANRVRNATASGFAGGVRRIRPISCQRTKADFRRMKMPGLIRCRGGLYCFHRLPIPHVSSDQLQQNEDRQQRKQFPTVP